MTTIEWLNAPPAVIQKRSVLDPLAEEHLPAAKVRASLLSHTGAFPSRIKERGCGSFPLLVGKIVIPRSVENPFIGATLVFDVGPQHLVISPWLWSTEYV